MENGVYGWHGTRPAENVINIAHGNLDPSRRSGQLYGSGEYCAENPEYSQGVYWGETNTLFLFFILKNPPNRYYKFQTHHVTNNPSKDRMFMVPILIATYNNQIPLKIEPDGFADVIHDYVWEWKGQLRWEEYGCGQINKNQIQSTIEEMYQKYCHDKSKAVFTMTFIRRTDKNTD